MSDLPRCKCAKICGDVPESEDHPLAVCKGLPGSESHGAALAPSGDEDGERVCAKHGAHDTATCPACCGEDVG